MTHPIGPTIRRLRRAKGMIADELAHRAKVGGQAIGRLERGDVDTTRMVTLIGIARALEMPLSTLIAEWEADAPESAKAAA